MSLQKAHYIALNTVPIFIMVGLIPLVENDYKLSLIYILITIVSLWIWRAKYDLLAFSVGIVLMTLSEFLFIQTGTETFTRTSFLDIMPLWLPLLWGYGFIAVKRITEIIDGRYKLARNKWI